MPRIHNRVEQKTLRQKLRNSATPAEVILWHYLRQRRLLGFKFRCQHGIGNFVVDFYCVSLALAIEIDGSGHWAEEQIVYDQARERWIGNQGILIVRFSNYEINTNIDGVITELIKVIKLRSQAHDHPSSLARHPPRRRGRVNLTLSFSFVPIRTVVTRPRPCADPGFVR